MFKTYNVANTSTSDLFSNYVGTGSTVPSALPAPWGLPWAENRWLTFSVYVNLGVQPLYTTKPELADRGRLKPLALG